ncbi:LppA family lipoprotein [Pseudactinotalea sp. HY158]|uniref:LppA family lipoprotein n=1 Tax=Pseudactinotalea sp. HY158 TaxID=2654547 RepID=UPI00129CB5B8|nr:LppA family lipoprotein [Pseudactinotalea sp. HY158]QGH68317.1 hypothetical protein GCE65_01405 [Pseudactinotalea sp. HY158]
MDPSTPTLPEALAHCRRMRAEMIAALDRQFGPQEWHDCADSRETCSYDASGREAVGLVSRQFEGTYPPPAWRSVGDLVAQIGRRYGFTDVRVLTEQPGRFDLAGGDNAGGIWRLSMAVNTVLMVRTPMAAPAREHVPSGS